MTSLRSSPPANDFATTHSGNGECLSGEFSLRSSLVKPAGVVSPKLSRILLENGAVSPPPAWIKKFEPIVTQDPTTIRKYLGKKSNSKRCVPIKCIAISTLYRSRTILPRARIATKYACPWKMG
ncbi:hypothetical protein AVEN_260581-1 [Araneus ventricosus]|uniref:Uncharacterized protein n=1 Tax=Araneus ventricosus TaxID=182803 RepID=A0A4Y2M1D1_ARAVE|nr:hypothetical protein AVEN_260581-1 [Araneus ventricosus]